MAENTHKWILEFYQRSRTTSKGQITIVKWRKQGKLARMNWNPRDWIGMCADFSLVPRVQLWWWRWSAGGASPLSQTQELLKFEEKIWQALKVWTWLLPNTYRMCWQKRWQCARSATLPRALHWPSSYKSRGLLLHFHLPNLRQNVSVVHAILELFKEGSENAVLV